MQKKNTYRRYRAHDWTFILYAFSIVLLIMLVGTMFYVRGKTIMQQQVRDKLLSTAAAAAMQFNGDTIEKIHSPKDAKNPVYLDTLNRLQRLRSTIPGLRYAYIMRKADDPRLLTFVADADALLSKKELDTNKNGVIDTDEAPAQPGDIYDTEAVPMMREAFIHPTADLEVAGDQWGDVISGYAPILNSRGLPVAILGIDMDAKEYNDIVTSIFSPLAVMLIILAAAGIAGIVISIHSQREFDKWRRMDAERSGLLRLTFHQLGGPLTILNWSLEMLQEQPPIESVNQYLDGMHEALSRLSNILHSLRDADMVHEGRIEHRLALTSLDSIINSVAGEFEHRLQLSKQSITLSLHTDLTMQIDQKLIGAVVRELIGNAIDYSEAGNVITIRTSVQSSFVQVEVHDHGHGILAKDVNSIFDEFARGSNATLYKPDGSGLGLYIVKGIIESAGGTIWIESTEGKGTSVYFQLPKE